MQLSANESKLNRSGSREKLTIRSLLKHSSSSVMTTPKITKPQKYQAPNPKSNNSNCSHYNKKLSNYVKSAHN